MKKSVSSFQFLFLLFGLSTAVVACNNDASEAGTNADSAANDNGNQIGNQYAMANLSGVYSDTAINGTARFEQAGESKVRLSIEISVPTKANQSVAVHIHENGSCADSAKAAGGHWNPTGENHGKWNEGAYHSGDIGNIQLDGAGKGSVQLESDRWTIGGSERTNILNKAIIVHSGVDDYTSQPAGNAGNRIGCGLVTAGNQ